MTATTLDAPRAVEQSSEQSDDLDSLVEQIVSQFPPLDDEGKRELGRLLAPAA